ncbi:MAG: hypothetical protein LBR58_06755 [Propionibacteriaceae bacterium]|jgi:hypothetical protein|nr:hypothetical protein [Propionibacteriaceae bacterium]
MHKLSIALLLPLFAACAAQPAAVDATDAQRLSAVQADAVLAGSTVANQASESNGGFERSTLTGKADLGAADSAFAAAIDLVDKLQADQWQIVAVQCKAEGIDFLMLKEFGDFTAAMSGGSDAVSWQWNVYVPFHSESANPWQPNTVVDAGTCLDAEDPAAAADSSGQLPENNFATAA